MTGAVAVSEVRFTPAPSRLIGTGLVGWVAFRAGPFAVHSVAVRRTAAGQLALSFPRKRGQRDPYLRPADRAAREGIEAQVLGVLAERGWVA